jgi:hypothetical protein
MTGRTANLRDPNAFTTSHRQLSFYSAVLSSDE